MNFFYFKVRNCIFSLIESNFGIVSKLATNFGAEIVLHKPFEMMWLFSARTSCRNGRCIDFKIQFKWVHPYICFLEEMGMVCSVQGYKVELRLTAWRTSHGWWVHAHNIFSPKKRSLCTRNEDFIPNRVNKYITV